jgi:hypothetical protein
MVFFQIQPWVRRQRLRLALFRQLGPRTVVAYLKIVYTVVTERLWMAPPRSRDLGTNRKQRHSMGRET